MSFFNIIITLCVGLIMAGGAVLTYKYRVLEAGHPSEVAIVSPGQFVKNIAAQHAALPKWDDKNWKGLNHHPAGYYKKKADAAKQEASKPNAVR